MANLNAISGKPRAIGNRVLVTDMYFGEQTTKSGIIISDDDGKTRGIYPRWCKVYSKGPTNTDPYNIGDWILVEHGRWTRGMLIDDGDEEKEIRMVETESILAYSDEKPKDTLTLGQEYSDGPVEFAPEHFMG
jgi:co-chaperonin GroES (HSP10)